MSDTKKKTDRDVPEWFRFLALELHIGASPREFEAIEPRIPWMLAQMLRRVSGMTIGNGFIAVDDAISETADALFNRAEDMAKADAACTHAQRMLDSETSTDWKKTGAWKKWEHACESLGIAILIVRHYRGVPDDAVVETHLWKAKKDELLATAVRKMLSMVEDHHRSMTAGVVKAERSYLRSMVFEPGDRTALVLIDERASQVRELLALLSGGALTDEQRAQMKDAILLMREVEDLITDERQRTEP